MVFKQKLPGAVPRPRLSAQELARELNVLVTVVWDALKSVGEFVDSPRKKVIEEPVIKKVYAHLGRTYAPEPTRHFSPWRFRGAGGPPRRAARGRGVHRPVGAPSSYESRDASAGLATTVPMLRMGGRPLSGRSTASRRRSAMRGWPMGSGAGRRSSPETCVLLVWFLLTCTQMSSAGQWRGGFARGSHPTRLYAS